MSFLKKLIFVGVCLIHRTHQTTFHSSIGHSYNYCLDVIGGLSTNLALFQMYECNGSPAQDFKIDTLYQNNGIDIFYTGVDIYTGASNYYYCIDQPVSSTIINQGLCNRIWTIVKNDDGTITFRLFHAPDYCLDILNANVFSASIIQSHVCNNSPAQKFLVGSQTPFYRLYNPSNGNHLWTPLKTERTDSGYVFEGIIGNILLDSDHNTVPLYRFIETNDQMFLTTDKNEGIRVGFTFIEIVGYVFLTPQTFYNTIAVHRFYNGRIHFYSTNEQEGTLSGYAHEAIVFYIIQTPVVPVVPVAPSAEMVGYYYKTFSSTADKAGPPSSMKGVLTMGIAFSGYVDYTNAELESNSVQNGIVGQKFLSIGGGNKYGRFTIASINAFNAKIPYIKGDGYTGLCYDIEIGDAGLTQAFLNSFQLARNNGLTVFVTVSYQAPFDVPDAKTQLMPALLASPNVNYISPMLYTSGCELVNNYAGGATEWGMWKNAVSKIVVSITSPSLYQDAVSHFNSFGITLHGYIVFDGTRVDQRDPTCV
uniref:DUF5648 domain-containing protein n=1 Tax=viral metagenome TaxID=1070528 RepID=A0A6C0CQ46_9ZZZZ